MRVPFLNGICARKSRPKVYECHNILETFKLKILGENMKEKEDLKI